MLSYAIGDIHGQLAKLIEAQALVAADRAEHGTSEAPLIHVGDLVDRGPDSRGVVQHLFDGVAHGEPWVVLKGNHDRMFLRFLDDPTAPEPGLRSGLDWLHPALGGRETLASYGVGLHRASPAEIHADALARVPRAHRDFLAALPAHHARGAEVFVHAGVRPGIPLGDQHEDDLVWIRKEFLYDTRDHGALVVHGHTPVDEATHYGNRLNIDTGAGYGGPVTAVAVEGREAWLLTPGGRVRIAPLLW